MPRLLPRSFGKQNLALNPFSLQPLAPKAEAHSSCRLPINLRSFLAAQLGCKAEANDDIILSFAARADQSTLNKLARAIRRYSTARAREAWTECSLNVAVFVEAHQHCRPVVLCLRCVRFDFGNAALYEHRSNGCLPITLARMDPSDVGGAAAEAVPDRIQHLVEEFRALRAAFGLPHFDLDCYVRGGQLTLMWRPLP